MSTVKTFWTAEEIRILEREYPAGGCLAVLPLLPNRTHNMIRSKAERMNLSIESRKKYEKQPATEWIDAAIQREYRNGIPRLKQLGKQLNRSPGWLKWRAGVLGLRKYSPGQPYSVWLPEERALLDQLMEKGLSITKIHYRFRKAGYARSLTGIRYYIEKMGLTWHRQSWTASDVAKAFNVNDKTVLGWIHSGKLTAKRTRGLSCDDRPVADLRAIAFGVTPREVRKFMLHYPELWDHRKMNREVLVDLLSGGDYGLSGGAFGTGER